VTHRCSRQAMTAALLVAAVVACARQDAQASSDSAVRAVQDSVNRAQPGYIVDSIFPAEEEIRRFNEGIPRPEGLTGGTSSREDLVRQFVAALRTSDTAALRALHVTRAEFGHLVFPESPHVQPPYKTKPLVIWMQLMSDSQRGMARLLERVAGDSVRISGLQCQQVADREGANRYWRGCTLNVVDAAGAARRLRLFGQIIERDGRLKFLSYSTDF